MGYSQENDAYLCLESASRRLFSSRDVRFDEMDFSLNKVFHKDLDSKGNENLGEGFFTEYLVSQPPMDVPSPDGAPSTPVEPNQVSEVDQSPITDTQSVSLNNHPTVLDSLVDTFPIELPTPNIDEIEDSHQEE